MKSKSINPLQDNLQTLDNKEVKSEYPSTDVSYDLALKAYDLAEKRFQVVEGRNEKILGYVSGLTLAVVAFLAGSNSPNLNLKSCLFITALILGVLSLLTGLAVMLLGRICAVDITTIKNHWIHLEENEFKKEMIIKASNDFDTNIKLIDQKSIFTLISAILFIGEIIFLIIWLLANPHLKS